MMHLELNQAGGKPLHVLCLGAHSDDIEIGCGGTILRFAEAFPDLHVTWVVFSASADRAAEARRAASLFLKDVANATVVVHGFRDGYLPYDPGVKDAFEDLKRSVSPDIVFTQYGQDLHQDHRLLSQLTWNTFRSHLVLEYEIPKYDGGLGSPNVFVALSEGVRRQKLEYLSEAFATQRDKRWFSDDTFSGLMRLRGIESGDPEGYAEAFYARKLLLTTGDRG